MRLFIVLLLALVVAPATAADYSPKDVLANAVDGYIRPGFNRLAVETATLQADIARACGTTGMEAFEAARDQFKAVVVAFSRVEFLRFGPLTEESRLERLLFWPDRKGIALKQVQAILADHDESATTLGELQQKSVAVQGLGALEYVLFGTDWEQLASAEGDFRCRYGLAIAEALQTVSAELAAAWMAPGGVAHRLAIPHAANADFRSMREALETLAGTLAHGMEAIRDTRLQPFLGRAGETPKPKSALFWRSGMTVPAIRANLEGLADFYHISRIGEATDADSLWVDNGATFEFANALRAAAIPTLPVEQALADASQKKALDYLVIVTQSLQTLLGENLAAALALSVGFSSLDGD